MPFEKDPKTGYLTPLGGYSIQGFTSDAKVKWLELYKECGNIGRALKEIGISRNTFYKHLQEDEKFLADFKACRLDHAEDLESDMLVRGKKGSFIHSIGWLRANFPEKWGNKTVIQHNSDGKKDINYAEAVDIEVIQPDALPKQGSNDA